MSSEDLLEWTRQDFPALKNRKDGKPPVYFDNACNTLVPQQVIGAIMQYYTDFPACGAGRSRHWFAQEVTDRIEGNPDTGKTGSRHTIKEFINARSENEIVFTQNTSHGINIVALGLKFKPGDVVVLTDKEHNSNLIPWLRLRKLGLVKTEHVESRGDVLDLDAYEQILKTNRVRLVSMAFSSNLTGYTIPAKEIISMAHRYGALVLLDGAQTVPHQAVDVQDLDVDFLAFSIHKMCGPRGIGILYGKQELMGQHPHEEDEAENVIIPAMLGGETIEDTTYDEYKLLPPPRRFEVGLQDYPGQIAAGVAVDYLQKIGMDKIGAQEKRLNSYLSTLLLERYGDTGWFHILGPNDTSKRGGILTFEVKRPNTIGISEELSENDNVMIRDGLFCVHSYLNKEFGYGWTRPRHPSEHRMTYRASLYFYNTLEECRIFADALHRIFKERAYV